MDLVNTVILENGIEYTEIDTLECDNIKYMLYANITDARDCCIRKLVVENNEKFLCRLDDDSLVVFANLNWIYLPLLTLFEFSAIVLGSVIGDKFISKLPYVDYYSNVVMCLIGLSLIFF